MRNCLTYALSMWFREGGYLLVRQSLAGRMFGIKSRWHPIWLVPHFLHMSQDLRITQYVPTDAQVERHSKSLWRFWLSLWHFDGHVVEGSCEGWIERFDCPLGIHAPD